jgi:hypothetical protein
MNFDLETNNKVAPRFSLVLPMRYRPVGHLQWRNGKTVNVSAGGLTFATGEPLEPGRILEVEISMTTSLLRPSRVVAISIVIRQDSGAQPFVTTVQHSKHHLVDGDF